MLAEFGRGEAIPKVLDKIRKAYEEGEFYALSLWREVRHELDAELK